MIFECVVSPGVPPTALKLKSLRALCAVCRLFLFTLQPRLFEDIVFSYSLDRSSWMQALRRRDSRALRLAKLAHRCSLVMPNKNTSGLQATKLSILNRPDKEYLGSLAAFGNLQVLQLYDYPLSMTLLLAVAALPNVTSFSLDGCPRVMEKPAKKLARVGPGWTVFECTRCNDPRGFRAYTPLLLQLMDIPQLKRLVTDQPSLLVELSRAAVNMELRELELDCHGLEEDVLNLFAQRCGQLTSLRLRANTFFSSDSICSNLSNVTCPPATAVRLLDSNRPVTSLTLLEHDLWATAPWFSVINTISRITLTRPTRIMDLSLPVTALPHFPLSFSLCVPTVTLRLGWHDFAWEQLDADMVRSGLRSLR